MDLSPAEIDNIIRQEAAGARPADEIEITDAMIEAGVCALMESGLLPDGLVAPDLSLAVKEVFKAMLAQRSI